MRIFMGMVAGAALAAGLSGTAVAADEWRQVAYECESGQNLDVALKANGAAARVKAGDRDMVRLVARPAKEGERFADSRHELRINGDVVTWQIGDRTPVKCTASGDAKLAESAK